MTWEEYFSFIEPAKPGQLVIDSAKLEAWIDSGRSRYRVYSKGDPFWEGPGLHETAVLMNEAKRVLREKTAKETFQAFLESVPRIYKQASIKTFIVWGNGEEDRTRQQHILAMARELNRSMFSFVIWSGGPGTGKTHLAWSVAKEWAQKYCVKFVKLGEMIRAIRKTWDGDGDEAVVLAEYRDPHLLVVDDVSVHAFMGNPRQHLYDIIDWRIEREKSTIITTNEKASELTAFLGAPLISRCHGNGGIWDFGNNDFRKGDS